MQRLWSGQEGALSTLRHAELNVTLKECLADLWQDALRADAAGLVNIVWVRTRAFCNYFRWLSSAAEGSGIDMDEATATQMPAVLRPPPALLALEDSGNSHGGDGDAGNYRVRESGYHIWRYTSANRQYVTVSS